MEFTRHLFKDNNFLLTIISGELENISFQKHILEFNSVARGIPHLRELVDCRGITNLDNLTVEATVAASQQEDKRPDSLLAVLVAESNPLIYGMARSYIAFPQFQRQDANIFTDYDEALNWLAINQREKEIFNTLVSSVNTADFNSTNTPLKE